MKFKVAELALSVGVLILGIGGAIGTAMLPSAGGYARVGPNVVPSIIAGGLVLLGLWLLYEALTGGWRNSRPDDAAARGEHSFHTGAFAWISVGLFAQMVLVQWAGFVLAAAVLFACVARGFGSARWARDFAVGLLMALCVFLFFVRFLNVNLPAGWLKPILGGAGI
jgi:putative tricarboxylic transport membrane protein